MRSGALMMLLAAMFVTGCTTVAGVAVDSNGRPHKTAAFSIGRPDGLGTYAVYRVDREGRFKFSILGSDENYVWVYDSVAEPMASARRVDRTELSDHMKLVVPTVGKGQDAGYLQDRQMLDRSKMDAQNMP